MKTYARIDHGIVMELFSTDADIADLFHPDLVWVDVTDVTPQPNDNWSATAAAGQWSFVSPPPSDQV